MLPTFLITRGNSGDCHDLFDGMADRERVDSLYKWYGIAVFACMRRHNNSLQTIMFICFVFFCNVFFFVIVDYADAVYVAAGGFNSVWI